MASFVKFQDFVEALCNKEHNLGADQLECYLSNTAPDVAADADKADLAEIAGGGGYTAGGMDTQNTAAEAGGTYTLTGTKIVVTATAGGVAQFRYVVLFNDTHATDGLIGYWDRGSALDLLEDETFSIKFNGSDTTGTILTVA